MYKLEYLDLHVNKSEQWVKKYLELNQIAYFSCFFEYNYSNMVVFNMINFDSFRIANWLESDDKNPFQAALELDQMIGFIVYDGGQVRYSNEARVILAKDESKPKGYRIENCFPCLTTSYGGNFVDTDYRFSHIQRMFVTYFNSEWLYDYDLNTDYRLVIENYVRNSSNETINNTIRELDLLVDCFHWGEEKIGQKLSMTFCCALNPKAYGLTYFEFILDIVATMRQLYKSIIFHSS